MTALMTISSFISLLTILLGAVLFLLALLKIKERSLRLAFLAFLLSGITWVLLVNIVPGLDPAAYAGTVIGRSLSRAIFVSISLTVLTGVVFSLLYIGDLEEFRRPRFFLFLSGWIFVLGAVPSGYFEEGVIATAEGIRPVYGPLHKVFVIHSLLSLVYFFWRLQRAYRSTYSEVLRFQIAYYRVCAYATFAMAVLFNAVLPALGERRLIGFGSASFFLLYVGVLYILINHRALFVMTVVRAMLRLPAFRDFPENVMTLRRVLFSLESLLIDRPERSFQTYEFSTGTEPLEFAIQRGVSLPQIAEQGRLERTLREQAGLVNDLSAQNQLLNMKLEQQARVLSRYLPESASAPETNSRPGPAETAAPDSISEEEVDEALQILMSEVDDGRGGYPFRPFGMSAAESALTYEELQQLLATGLIEIREDGTGKFTARGITRLNLLEENGKA